MSIWVRVGDFVATLASSALTSLVEAVRTAFEGDPETRRRVSFSIAMIALSAKMAKADGIVTDHEIRAFQQIFSIPESERTHVARLYNLAKQDIAGYESYAAQMASLCGSGHQNCACLQDILDGLFHIAKADGYVHEKELAFLSSVGEIFGFDEAHFEAIAARHVHLGEADPYTVLGLPRGTSFDEARRRYRQLASENHPDRLVARGVPREFLIIANDRIAAINGAWEKIEKALKAA
ncbi:J domain-containing protein [Phyllobacterium leguminum]|uniref:DnaJ like chaperone protein n=1 Tax=Phyllobacterium leguminum TaxID=314237 RepID=A0A318T5G5_9HYPH|nr:DnaJ family molecular chaperone [Phyllobacterium leguminum]PYE90180.1 DnaJ like chaperone protein [Phyllobacterium leguminum]